MSGWRRAYLQMGELLQEHWPAWLSLSAVLVAAMCGSWVWSIGGFTRDTYRFAMASGFLVAIVVGFGVFRVAYSQGFTGTGRIFPGLAIVYGALGSILIGWAIWQFGMIQFGGFDHSVITEIGWRMMQGQRPYTGFPCTFPVGFAIGSYMSFRLFGVSWSAIVLWEAAFAGLTTLWLCLLLVRLGIRADLALLLTASWQAAMSVLVGYWWYNSATEVCAVLFVVSSLCLWQRPNGRLEALSYVASLALIASMKPNVAGPLIVGVTVALLTSRRHRVKTVLLSLAAFVVFTCIAWSFALSVSKIMSSYLSVTSRAFGLRQFLQDMTVDEKIFSLLFIAAALVPIIFPRRRHCLGGQADISIAYAAVLAGACGLLTNGELKVVDLPLVLAAGLWMAYRQAYDDGERGERMALLGLIDPQGNGQGSACAAGEKREYHKRFLPAWVLSLSAAVLIFSLIGGAVRERVRGIGMGTFFEYHIPATRIPNGFFKGMRVSRALDVYNAELGRWVSTHPHEIPYLGPRMNWGYAAYRIPSKEGSLLFWQAGVTYQTSAEAQWLDRWLKEKYQTVILLAYGRRIGDKLVFFPDITYLPKGLVADLRDNYRIERGYAPLVILRRPSE